MYTQKIPEIKKDAVFSFFSCLYLNDDSLFPNWTQSIIFFRLY